jgi:tetratricopeptide (TPR) repeat protein
MMALLVIGLGLTQAQSNRQSASTDPLVRQVRVALGHGDPDTAKRLASNTAAPAASREFAQALVEIYQGADDSARKRLEGLVSGGAGGEAALELALLEIRHGQRDAARQRLQPLTRTQNLSTPDDYFLFARAMRALAQLSDDGKSRSDGFHLVDQALARLKDVGRADVYTERASLSRQYHQYNFVPEDIQKALQADKSWVQAYLELSRALAIDDSEGAAETFEAARKIAPDDPDVWLLAAERALDADDLTSAKAALDNAAKGRPGSVEESALRAAVGYAERRPADIEAAIVRVRDINPLSARGYLAAGEEAARKYRFEDAAGFARKAIAVDPIDPDGPADLGLYLLRTGDEAEARKALDAAWALDSSNPLTKNLLDMLDHLDDFEVVPDGELIFKFPKDEAAVLKPYALPLGALAYKTFSERYAFKPTGPILVEVFAKHDDFAVRTVGLMGLTGALGACFGRVVTMDSPKARPPGDFSWQATEWHELAHVFTLQLSQYRVPRWLTEGISVFEEHRRVPAWGRELVLEYARNLQRGKTFGVKGLPDAFKHPESLSLAYFEASLVVEHLVEQHGDAGLRTLLLAYADGATDSEAFSKAFGQTIDQVESGFGAFVKEHYGALSAALADPPSQVDPKDLAGLKARAAAAQGNFVSQWAYGRALFESGDFANAKAPLERAAELAPEAQGSTSPHGLLSQIAEREGDLTRARKELRDLLVYDHTNVDAARRLAALAAKANATDDQDLALRLIADLDPFDGDVHTVLGKRELAKGRQQAALIEFQAALALKPANLAEAHTDVGEVLLALGRREEARKEALLALQSAPQYSRAQDLLLASSGKN